MQIVLNNEELDIQFENERLLAEVLRGITDWIKSDSYYLKEFILDGKLYSLLDQPTGDWDFDLFPQELEQIRKLELISAPMQAHIQMKLYETPQKVILESENPTLESLKTLYDYFQIARTAFESQQFIFLQDFFSDSESLVELLRRSVSQVEARLWHQGGGQNQGEWSPSDDDNPLVLELQASLALWDYFQDDARNAEAIKLWDNGSVCSNKERMLAILTDILLLLKESYEDYSNWVSHSSRQTEKTNQDHSTLQPQAELPQPSPFCDMNLAEIQVQLHAKSQQLEESVVQLQSGRMQQSLYYVSELSLLLEQVLQQEDVKQNCQLAVLFAQLEPFLLDLTNAIQDTDTVSIGDLVEYEIIPLIQQIIDELG